LKDLTPKTAYNIHLDVYIKTSKLETPFKLSSTNARHLYWSFRQQLVHHTITGCNLQPGDLLGSGTISGPTEDSYGSLLELCWKGTKPINLPNGEVRRFLENGDSIIISGHCQGDSYRIGFGNCTGTVLANTLNFQ